jgi:hypothetical protein
MPSQGVGGARCARRAGTITGVEWEEAMPRTGEDARTEKTDGAARAESVRMTNAEIAEARNRLKKLAKVGPPPEEQKQGALAIVKQLFPEIAQARAAGWSWPRIQQVIGPKAARWKPETLERYFQLVRKQGLEGKQGRLERKPRPASGAPLPKPALDKAEGRKGNEGQGSGSQGKFKANVLD